MKRCGFWVIGFLVVSLSPCGMAHELRPAYLELREVVPGEFAVTWRTPDKAGRPALFPELPEVCRPRGPAQVEQRSDASVHRWRIEVPADSLRGAVIEFPGLTPELMDVLVRVVWREGPGWTSVVRGEGGLRIPYRPTGSSTLSRYMVLGVEHIWFGFDHLLFVLGLLWIVRGWQRLIGTVTAFTLAHSITLTLAVTGSMRLSSAPVEAVIALSILLLACELARNTQGLTSRYTWLIGFGFGLLHGFGFAGALAEVGLPSGAMFWALAGFNLGVEFGQLVFVLALVLGRLVWRRYVTPSDSWLVQLPVYGMGTVAVFWFCERLAAFP